MLDRMKITTRLEELDAQMNAFAYTPIAAPGMTEDEVLDRIHKIGLDAFQDEIIMAIVAEENDLRTLLNYAV